MSSGCSNYNQRESSRPNSGDDSPPRSGGNQPRSAGPSPSSGPSPEPDVDSFNPMRIRSQSPSGGRQPDRNENIYQSPGSAESSGASTTWPSTPRGGGYSYSGTPPRTGNRDSGSRGYSYSGTSPRTGNYSSRSRGYSYSGTPPRTGNRDSRSRGYSYSGTPPRTGNYDSRSPAPGSARGTPPSTGEHYLSFPRMPDSARGTPPSTGNYDSDFPAMPGSAQARTGEYDSDFSAMPGSAQARTGEYDSDFSAMPGSARATPPSTGNYASRSPPAPTTVYATTAAVATPSAGPSSASGFLLRGQGYVDNGERELISERGEEIPGASSPNFQGVNAGEQPEEVYLELELEADPTWRTWVQSHCQSVLQADYDWRRVAQALSPYRTSHRGKDAILPKMPTKRASVALQGVVARQLQANHFELHFRTNDRYTEYHIKWDPYPRNKDQRRELYQELLNVHGGQFDGMDGVISAYDGGNRIFTNRPFRWPEEELRHGVTLTLDYILPTVSAQTVRYAATIKKEGSLDHDNLTDFLHNQGEPTFPAKYIQMLDVVVKQFCLSEYLQSGRSFFKRGTEGDLGDLLLTMSGFFQSVRALRGGLFLNVDVSCTTFYKQQALMKHWLLFLRLIGNPEAVSSAAFDRLVREKKNLGPNDFKAAREHFTKMRVVSSHGKDQPNILQQGQAPQARVAPKVRTYVICDLAEKSAREMMVEDWSHPEHRPVSFPTFLEYKYKYRVQAEIDESDGTTKSTESLPCIKVAKKKECYLTWGCCRLQEGQRFGGKLPDVLQRTMLSRAVKTPLDRSDTIRNWVQQRFGIDESTPGVDNWGDIFGFSVGSQLATVEALIMPSPSMKTGSERPVQSKDGAFRMDRGEKVLKPAQIQHWAVLYFSREVQEDQLSWAIVEALRRECCQRGLAWGEIPSIGTLLSRANELRGNEYQRKREVLADELSNLVRRFEQVNANGPVKLDLIVCLMKRKMTPEYGAFKSLCDRVHGVPTQVVLTEKFGKTAPAKWALQLQNLMLKINVKCGGANFAVHDQTPMPILRTEPTMLLGADVTHPSSAEHGGGFDCSLAAVVGTTDCDAVNYACRIRVQDGRKEEIEDFQEMVLELLQEFMLQAKVRPARILYFRDGVGESQYVQTLQTEGIALMKAAQQIDPEYNPKIFIALVVKRHHTRFFELNLSPRDQGPKANIPAGTVVDSGVTHPREYDFFLCSHPPGQGTSRPAHYQVLADQICIYPVDLYSFVFNLCHTFARCTKSVSLIPPVYYAHLAAFRARHYMEHHNVMERLSRTRPAQNARDRGRRTIPRDLDAHPRLRNRLWFI